MRSGERSSFDLARGDRQHSNVRAERACAAAPGERVGTRAPTLFKRRATRSLLQLTRRVFSALRCRVPKPAVT
jgi:hypothetical protein